MTRFLMTFAFAALAGSAWSAQKSVTLSIPSMDCAACPITVKQALTKVDGVKAVSSNLDKRQTTVTFDDAKVTPALITQATKDAGFPSTVMKQ
ncbi:MAG: mercury resistance system periplasmic binding protein MerP [Burkholderiales bacterium]|nr:mercury resistance system periplasmic binding protein MerP [Burkholderiales bacterium]